MGNGRLVLWLTAIAMLCSTLAVRAQDQGEDVVRIRTRAVFLDALIKDKRTGLPVKDLARDDFQVFDDGKARAITYFSREGEAREKPLALVIALDVYGGRSISYLKKKEVAEQLVRLCLIGALRERAIRVVLQPRGGAGLLRQQDGVVKAER